MTWNRSLFFDLGAIIATETRALWLAGATEVRYSCAGDAGWLNPRYRRKPKGVMQRTKHRLSLHHYRHHNVNNRHSVVHSARAAWCRSRRGRACLVSASTAGRPTSTSTGTPGRSHTHPPGACSFCSLTDGSVAMRVSRAHLCLSKCLGSLACTHVQVGP